jgi:hypothetical protein
LGAETPQLCPPAFSDDPQYTTFSYTYCPGGLEISSDSYIYYPGESEISRESLHLTIPPTNDPGDWKFLDSYIYDPGAIRNLKPGQQIVHHLSLPPQIIQENQKFPKLLFPTLTLVYAIRKQLLISPKLKGTNKVFDGTGRMFWWT